MSEVINIVFQVGFGVLAGFVSGYAFKKLVKAILFLIGVAIIFIMYLNWQGYINVNYDILVSKIEEWIESISGQGNIIASQIVANLPFAGSFLAGFAIGLHKA